VRQWVGSILFTFFLFATVPIYGSVALLTAPLPRACTYAVAVFWVDSMFWLLRVLCRLDYVVEGHEHLPARSSIVLLKHSSAWETLPVPLDYVHARMRDTHDLWHAVTGYSGDVLGEAALLGFIFAQTWNPGIAFILGIAVTKTIRSKIGDGPEARRTIMDGFRRGQKTAWLPEQEWESMLALPIEEVRRRLNVGPLPVYKEVRSAELKAAA